jgi:CRP-like cAMP-binding protein
MNDFPRITYDDIAATPLGQALGDAVGHAVARRLVRRVMSPGDVLFRQGDAGDRLYVVLRGRLCAVIVSEGALTLRPPFDGYASSDFTHMDPIAEIGFRHASEHVTQWTTGVCSCAREG